VPFPSSAPSVFCERLLRAKMAQKTDRGFFKSLHNRSLTQFFEFARGLAQSALMGQRFGCRPFLMRHRL